ncbi:MAG: class I SAM-dependent methyltransferase [Verrucomicrobia bacterium]|nr:class I SAM-dependent methyltransferase [Verrucomicrobiota bacterium]
MITQLKKQAKAADSVATKAQAIFRLLLHDYHPRDFAVSFWDGSQWPSEDGTPRFTLMVRHPDALRRMLKTNRNDLSLSEAFISGDLDVEGEIEAAMPVANYLIGRTWPTFTLLRLGKNLLGMPRLERVPRKDRLPAELSGELHSIERDRQAVTYHYDVSNDFYALWLDEQMVYSCAYFETTDEGLERAQARKLDYLCRKLRLRPGERLLDIGCGWGALIMHSAQKYGVDALGITLSKNQATFANERIKRAGLQGKCRVEVRDYRDLNEVSGFEKIVSVGMFEHVGESQLPLYFQHVWRLLRKGGVFLNHGIANRAIDPRPKGPTFISRYVFPDGDLVPINATLRYAEEAGFEVRDVESLREHYKLTLRHWTQRLESCREEALRVVEESTYRVWRLFLPGSAYAFGAGLLNIYQTLLLKPDEGRSGLPLTRADWYCDS